MTTFNYSDHSDSEDSKMSGCGFESQHLILDDCKQC